MQQTINRQGIVAPLGQPVSTLSRALRFGPWLLGLLILSGVVVLTTYVKEIESFTQLLHQAAPVWLLVGAVLQIATYFSTAAVWFLTLRRAGARYSMRTLVPLGVAKLFSEQALPSGGVSGTAFFVAVLTRRGVAAELCMAALLVSLVSYYTTYLLAAVLSLALLRLYHVANAWIAAVTILFCVVAIIIPAGTLWLHRRSQRSLPLWLMRVPRLSKLLDTIGDAPS